MCEMTIAEYNKIHNTNLPDNYSELLIKELNLESNNIMNITSTPPIVWLTGLPQSGKSTIAKELDKLLEEQFIGTSILDGDVIRTGLCSDLGFSPEHRIENIRRISEVAKITNEVGAFVIISVINPFHTSRQIAKSILGESYIEVYVDCPLHKCVERDTKDLYSRAILGDITIPYETPLEPHIIVDSGSKTAHECAQIVFDFIKDRL